MLVGFSFGATVRGFADAFAAFNGALVWWHGGDDGFARRELDGH
jgi:hypothetical protein